MIVSVSPSCLLKMKGDLQTHIVISYNFLLLFLLFTTVLSQWDFSHGKFRLLSPGKAHCDRVAPPNVRCMLGVLVFLQSPNSGMDYRILIVHTAVNACNCTWGCTNTIRQSALKVDSGRKIPSHTR